MSRPTIDEGGITMKKDKPPLTEEDIRKYDNVPVDVAARYIGSSTSTIYDALQRQRAPFGFATKKSESWTYNISPGLLIKYKRGDLPTYRLEEIIELAAEGVGRVVDAKLELVDRLLKVVSLAS